MPGLLLKILAPKTVFQELKTRVEKEEEKASVRINIPKLVSWGAGLRNHTIQGLNAYNEVLRQIYVCIYIYICIIYIYIYILYTHIYMYIYVIYVVVRLVRTTRG